MAASVTRGQIKTDARLFADERPGGASTFVDDTEDNRLIHLRAAELYDKLLKARGHEYYATTTPLAIVSDTSLYNQPADFFELLSLTLEWSATDHELVEPFELLERHILQGGVWARGSTKGYRVRGTQIEILPVPKSAVTGRLLYVPAFGGFASDAATFDGVNGWERWISIAVAIDKLSIAGLPTGHLEKLLAPMEVRIEELAAQRDAGHPARIRNVYPESNSRRWWPRL